MLKKIDISEIYKKPERELRGSLAIPSAVNGYSLCIEYAKKWFFSKISENFFNGIYIDGRYALDEFKKYTDIQTQISRKTPNLAIVPNIESAYNRDFVDFTPNMLGIDNYIKRSRLEMPFFEDYARNLKIYMAYKAIQVNFTFRIKVETKAQQLDIAEFMNIAYKCGATFGEEIDQDVHIPRQLMMNLARDAGFRVVNDTIVDILQFIGYLNTNSKLPITYKFRGVNGRHEFFIRSKSQYVHTRIGELDKDNGERRNQLEGSFTIEMPTTVTYPVPQYYMYYSEISHDNIASGLAPADENIIGIYALNMTNIPDVNNNGWMLYMTTDVLEEDRSVPLYINNIFELFDSVNEEETDIQKIIKYNNEQHINSEIFMDIKLFNNGYEEPCTINWVTGEFRSKNILEWDKSIMAIYINKQYVNEQMIELEAYYKNRVD